MICWFLATGFSADLYIHDKRTVSYRVHQRAEWWGGEVWFLIGVGLQVVGQMQAMNVVF